MSSPPAMTTTSYAILGLLAVKPWTTHELVQQVDRSLRRMWPRAQSKLYEEPKKLVAHGYARATDDSVGRRRRTRYTITAKGRRALAAWLQEPGDGPILEFEQLLKISFADSGSKADIVANLDGHPRVGARAERGEPGDGPRLPRRPQRVSRARRAQPAGGPLPHRLLRDGRALGRLGVTARRRLARRRPRRPVRSWRPPRRVSAWPRAWQRSSGSAPTATFRWTEISNATGPSRDEVRSKAIGHRCGPGRTRRSRPATHARAAGISISGKRTALRVLTLLGSTRSGVPQADSHAARPEFAARSAVGSLWRTGQSAA